MLRFFKVNGYKAHLSSGKPKIRFVSHLIWIEMLSDFLLEWCQVFRSGL